MATKRLTFKDFVAVSGPRVEGIHEAMRELASKEVLVGVPEEKTERDADEDDKSGLTNAAIAYIHDTGMPEQNIPARPFMVPGIEQGLPKIIEALQITARTVLKSREPHLMVEPGLHRVGLVAQAALRAKINEGIPPPLADATLKERARRGRKGAKQELERRSRGEDASTEFAKPLIDTGQLRNALTYVIRPRKKRKVV